MGAARGRGWSQVTTPGLLVTTHLQRTAAPESPPMNKPPADRPLDAERVATLVSAQFPDLTGAPVTRVGAGWDNEIYQVGAWYFRFPRGADNVPWMLRELAFQPAVAAALSPLPVPRYERLGEPREGLFPYPFAGYRPVPGVGADRGPRHPGLAQALGETLGRLHAVDPAQIPRTPAGWEDEGLSAAYPALLKRAELARARVPPEVMAPAAPYLDATSAI
jgi:aminoglycoside phosphotransferase (APT) family kinase protein